MAALLIAFIVIVALLITLLIGLNNRYRAYDAAGTTAPAQQPAADELYYEGQPTDGQLERWGKKDEEWLRNEYHRCPGFYRTWASAGGGDRIPQTILNEMDKYSAIVARLDEQSHVRHREHAEHK